jgi:hypothetical protein
MEKENKTTSRASQTRSKTERPKVWVHPSALDAPNAPDGFRYRWIRAESVGFQDTKNVSGRLREGYELVRAEEIETHLIIQPLKTVNTKGLSELEAFYLRRYLRKSRSKDRSI